MSTATLPADRIKHIPGSVDLKIIPFIEIIPESGVDLLPVISEYGSEKLNVIFTSAHAVKIVSGWLKQKPDWIIYCIRNETRMAVQNFFGSDLNCHFADNALALSEWMISKGVKKALFFCGDQRLDILPEGLKKNGVELKELIVYKTRLKPERITLPPDIILFFSPTAVRSFFQKNEISSVTTIFAMGTTTAAALKKYTEQPVIISPEADKGYVFNMALHHAASHSIS